MRENFNFGKQLKQAREEKGLTRLELASLIGVQYYNISDWETNRSEPNFLVLVNLCRVLDTTPNDLFDFN